MLLVAPILSGLAAWKAQPGLATFAGVLSATLVVAFLVAVWAMSAKPS